jgi:hypothetical protein
LSEVRLDGSNRGCIALVSNVGEGKFYAAQAYNEAAAKNKAMIACKDSGLECQFEDYSRDDACNL